MKTRALRSLLPLAALATVAAGCDTDQPEPSCLVSHLSYATKYIPVQGGNPNNCPAIPGESIGASKFSELNVPGGQVALTPSGVASVTTPSGGTVAAQGSLATDTPEANVCRVDNVQPVEGTVEEEGGATSTLRYEFSDVQFWVTAAAPGFQMKGNVAITQDGCTAQYRFLGMSPAVDCTQHDDDGNPIVNPDGTFAIDPGACSPEADPAAGRPTGSGINPDLQTECSPTIGLCVLTGEDFQQVQ